MASPKPLKTVQSRESVQYLFTLMKFLGWIPPSNGPKRYVYFCWAIVPFFFGMAYLPMGLTYSYIMDLKSFTPGSFLTSLQVDLNAYGAAAKALSVFLSLSRLQETNKLFDIMDQRVKNAKEKAMIYELVVKTKRVYLSYAILYFLFVFSTFLSNTIVGHPPWMVYNPFFDWRSGTLNLWIHSFIEFLMMGSTVLEDLAADTYLVLYIIIIRTHFDLLKTNVTNLRTDQMKTEDENYDELVECIKDHKNILECCRLLRPIISRTIFVQFILIGSVLGLTLINVFFFSTFWTGLASSFFILCIIVQTFPFCYLCNMLSDDCLDLANIISQSNWHNAEQRYKKTLIIFIHHVQQPITFLAGGIIPISMSSNISVAKFAFSIITIVNQMNLAERFQ